VKQNCAGFHPQKYAFFWNEEILKRLFEQNAKNFALLRAFCQIFVCRPPRIHQRAAELNVSTARLIFSLDFPNLSYNFARRSIAVAHDVHAPLLARAAATIKPINACDL